MHDTRVLTVSVCKLRNPFTGKSFEDLLSWRPEFELDDGSQDAIKKAADIIKGGGIVSFPTETVYGLGANGLDGESSLKIYAAKGRPCDNPLILHISELKMLSDILPSDTKLPVVYEKLIARFWPGPLSIIIPRGEQVPLISTGNLETVAVRFPSHPLALALIDACGFPIAAPSANLSGRPSPTRATDVLEDLSGRVPLILDGGPSINGLESTVVNAYNVQPPVILRPGGISLEDIRSVNMLRDTIVSPHLNDSSDIPQAPGMKYKHYSPKAKIILFMSSARTPPDAVPGSEDMYKALQNEASIIMKKIPEAKIGILTLESDKETIRRYEDIAPGKVHVLSLSAEPTQELGLALSSAAQVLFFSFREFDRLAVDYIFAEAVPEIGPGLAIMNRLSKAAHMTKYI